MDITRKSYEQNPRTFIKKQHILIGIVFMMIIVLTTFYNVTSLNILPSYFLLNDHLNRSNEMNTTIQLSSSTSRATESSRRKSDEIICDNSSTSCEQIHCVIIVRNLGGRLGNRMFIFASAYGLARTHHCRLYVSGTIRQELGNYFQMQSIDEKIWLNENALKDLKNIEKKDTVCSFRPDMLRMNAFQTIELFGYWQSYLHFDAYRDEIREIFTAHNSTLIRLAGYFTEISKGICPSCTPFPFAIHREFRQIFRTRFNITWIAIHIRRMDFRGLGYSSDEQYIYRAMDFYRRRYGRENVRFLVASDDRTYCRQILINDEKSGQVFILPNHFSLIDDMIALSLCHHSIITGGTFGFWIGYLAGGEVIHDVKYKAGCSRVEYYPPWFLLIGALPEENKQG